MENDFEDSFASDSPSNPSNPSPLSASSATASTGAPSSFTLGTGKSSQWLKVSLFVGTLLLGFAAWWMSRSNQGSVAAPLKTEIEADAAEQASRVPAKDFSLPDASGQSKKLSDFRGNVVILSFWASWCGPCLTELPTFSEIESKFRDRGLKVMAVNVDDDDIGKTFASEFWKKRNLQFTTYFDPEKAAAQLYEIDTLPATFVVDRQGRIALSAFGANDWSSHDAIDLIESLLVEKESGKN